jgi:hypothetical protein
VELTLMAGKRLNGVQQAAPLVVLDLDLDNVLVLALMDKDMAVVAMVSLLVVNQMIDTMVVNQMIDTMVVNQMIDMMVVNQMIDMMVHHLLDIMHLVIAPKVVSQGAKHLNLLQVFL